jgi:hypothetical protein
MVQVFMANLLAKVEETTEPWRAQSPPRASAYEQIRSNGEWHPGFIKTSGISLSMALTMAGVKRGGIGPACGCTGITKRLGVELENGRY